MNTGGLCHGCAPYPLLRNAASILISSTMTKRATTRPEGFEKPPYWKSEPPPAPQKPKVDEELSPTRYGDWVKDGIAIDF